jgi:hypothetical protein
MTADGGIPSTGRPARQPRPRFWAKYTRILLPGMLGFVAIAYAKDWRLGVGMGIFFALVWSWIFALWVLSDRWEWARRRTEALELGSPPPKI